MFKNIFIKNLRGISNLHIKDFKQFNLFVGQNQSGKTTVLESLFLITGPNNPNLPMNISAFRNLNIIDENYWETIFHKLNPKTNIEIEAFWKNNIGQFRKLIIKLNENNIYQIQADKGITGSQTSNSKESFSESGVKKEGFILKYSLRKEGEEKELMLSSRIYPTSDHKQLIVEKIPRKYEEKLRGIFVVSNYFSADLTKRYNNLKINKKIGKIIKILRIIEPSLKDLHLGPNGIIYCDIGLDRYIPINVMGGGILKILTVIMAILDAENGVVLIDELENGLHYSSQEVLWTAILETASDHNVQIFASTHSMENVKALSTSYSKKQKMRDNLRVYRLERENNNFNVITYNQKVLYESLDSKWEVR